MKKGNWIGIDKRVVSLLPKDRPYSLIEALISLSVDLDAKDRPIPTSISGYAALWGWSRHRVRTFLSVLQSGDDYHADRKGTGRGHPIRLIFKNLPVKEDRKGTEAGQAGDTTINRNTQSSKKETHKGPVYAAPVRPVSFVQFLQQYPKGPEIFPSARVIAHFLDAYTKHVNDAHPNLKPDQWNTVMEHILVVTADQETIQVDPDTMIRMMDRYFTVKFDKGCTYSILHFAAEEVKKNRYYEVMRTG